jgi:F-type H+-transporting ATPase subunit c
MFLSQIAITVTGMQTVSLVVGTAAAFGVAWIGTKAVESIGRNPGAFNPVLIMGLLAMALVEGLAILAFFVVNR